MFIPKDRLCYKFGATTKQLLPTYSGSTSHMHSIPSLSTPISSGFCHHSDFPPRWSSMGCLQPLHFGSSSGDALGFGFSVSASRHATQVRAPSMRQKLPTMGCSQWVHLKHSGCHTLPGTEAWEPAVWSWRMYADAILNKYTQEGNHGSSQTRNTLTLSIHSTSTISTISQASPDKKLSQALLPLHSFTPSMFFPIFLERLEADHSQANGTTTNKKKHQLINSESSTSPVAGYRV